MTLQQGQGVSMLPKKCVASKSHAEGLERAPQKVLLSPPNQAPWLIRIPSTQPSDIGSGITVRQHQEQVVGMRWTLQACSGA